VPKKAGIAEGKTVFYISLVLPGRLPPPRRLEPNGTRLLGRGRGKSLS
jgi:hypothetical protein